MVLEKWPRISIVTPSFNQGKYIAETIESVLKQNYFNLEHIVIDGGSTDGTLEILKRYPHLLVISEPDHGQAEAINKGFRFATGEIWGFLNSDDTLLPGALHRISQEIDPQRGRHIVMGRCRFIDEQGRFIGIEHPSHFESHQRVLAIWKGYMVPQPAVFWTPEVWKTCGPMDEGLKFTLDYDLFCRFSKKYRFHFVNQIIATYRLHSESKTEQWTEGQRLEDGIRISRRYWGMPLTLMFWELTFSLACYRFNRIGRALNLLKRAQECWSLKQRIKWFPFALLGGVLAPEVVFYGAVYPFLKKFSKGILIKALSHLKKKRKDYPQTAAYFDRTEPWPDGWVGPRLIVTREAIGEAHTVVIQGWVDLRYINQPFFLTLSVDGGEIGKQPIEKGGHFRLEFPLPQSLAPGAHSLEVHTSTWFVSHRFFRNRDYRPLSFQLGEIQFSSEKRSG